MRMHLEFFNGHTCDVVAIADVHGQSLYYDSYKLSDGRTCELTLNVTAERLEFDDKDDVCRAELCGARGVLSLAGFDRASRKPIRYMPRLLKSRELADAVTEYETAHPK